MERASPSPCASKLTTPPCTDHAKEARSPSIIRILTSEPSPGLRVMLISSRHLTAGVAFSAAAAAASFTGAGLVVGAGLAAGGMEVVDAAASAAAGAASA